MENVYKFFNKNNIIPEEKFIGFSDLNKIEYTIEFSISINDFSVNDFDVPDFYENGSKFYCNDIPIDSHSKFCSTFNSLKNANNSIQFLIKKFLSLENCIQVYSSEGQIAFLKEFLKLKIEKIQNQTKKINLISYRDDSFFYNLNVTSSVFNFSIIASEDENLSENTLAFIKKFKKTKATISLIPDILDEVTYRKVPLFPVIKSLIGILANESRVNKFFFKGKYNYTLIADNEYKIQKMYDHFASLKHIFEFIYINNSTSDQKQTFFRKTICDSLKHDIEINISELPNDYFENVFNDTKYLFDTFENGEVSAFLKEKKEVLKEYVNVSKEIFTHINTSKNNVLKTLLTVIASIITNIVLKIRSDIPELQSILIISCALFIVIISLIFHLYSDYSNEAVLNNRVKIFTKHFSFLSSKADEIKEDMYSSLKDEMKNFSNLLGFISILYLLIIICLAIYITYYTIQLV